jgi:CxxC motif-containing protein (DUF1111 family)
MSAHLPRLGASYLGLFLVLPLLAAPPDGRELFTREWQHNDPRSTAGDGLGPMFNGTSCVACHNQGGVGGAGSREHNVVVATVFGKSGKLRHSATMNIRVFSGEADEPIVSDDEQKRARIASQRAQLAALHPAFLKSRNIVLQRFSVDDKYEDFLAKFGSLERRESDDNRRGWGKGGPRPPEVPTVTKLSDDEQKYYHSLLRGADLHLAGLHDVKDLTVRLSERSTPPLFGSGRIDKVRNADLLAAAERRYAGFPEVNGRVARLPGGKLGRFGWKGQQSSLKEFVLGACAMELGLEVPDHPQAVAVLRDDYKPPGLDMTDIECQAMVDFIALLPSPRQLAPGGAAARKPLVAGRRLFEHIGCAACHSPEIGEVRGIYSDLLLHDLGPKLADQGSYGSAPSALVDEGETKLPLPSLDERATDKLKPSGEANLIGALQQEWRTPPLWGLRDSAPYLHDGRAATIEQAIALHEGEALRSARMFLKLSPEERSQLLSFLRSLAAP